MPFEVHMQRTAVKAAKEMGVKLQVLDGQGSSPKQVADTKTPSPAARRALSSPRTTSTRSPARWMKFRMRSCRWSPLTAPSTARKSAALRGQQLQGRRAIGDFVKTKFPDGAEIILLTGQPGSSSNIERTKGIRDSLKAGGDKYKIVADQTGNWMRSEGMRIVESVLPSLPKRPQVILSANDDMALGRSKPCRAGREAGRNSGHRL